MDDKFIVIIDTEDKKNKIKYFYIPRRVPFPTRGNMKHSLFGRVQPESEGPSVLSQLFD